VKTTEGLFYRKNQLKVFGKGFGGDSPQCGEMYAGQRGAPPSEENLSSERFAPIKSAIFEEFSNFLPFLSKKNEKISIFALKFPVRCDIIIVNCIKCLWKIVK
ncbi:MAG: hypothetical protein IJL33_05485, partial [Ruminococcus sp.]|nr:hypothetical protein [Ruminococcus sp.]